MPRPFKHRCINAQPQAVVYKPAGIPARQLQWITLHLDEFETIRLLDHQGLDQQQAADIMGVSRPTVTRIYAAARQKIAAALTLGQAICIEGGPVAAPMIEPQRAGFGQGRGRRRRRGNPNF